MIPGTQRDSSPVSQYRPMSILSRFFSVQGFFILRDLQLGSDAQGCTTLLCNANTLEGPLQVPLEVKGPLVE